MPSPRTDQDRSAPGRRLELAQGLTAFLQRLNTRFVMAIAAVALVGLLVSGLAINQILPGYFAEQTRQRIETAALSTSILIRRDIERLVEQRPDMNAVQAAEARDGFVVPRAARDAARFFTATVTIFNERGQRVALAEPEDVEGLDAQGLRRDADVAPVRVRVEVDLGGGRQTTYEVMLSEPYSTRQETLARIQGALIGAGLLALAVAVVMGVIAARRVTAPISQLRKLAGRVARGQLDERATASGVLEVDELAAQFNVMADRLALTLSMLEADRDRLREFVADVSHELRTPTAALRMYNELQREGDVDEPTRVEFLERSAEQIRRLEWMSTNLLDLSRIDAGIFPLDMHSGDLRDPIRAVVEAHAGVAERRGISLGSQVPVHGVELRFDRERIVQLLTNLVENALKFTARGGQVEIMLEEVPGGGATIEVRDTGPGIPAEELPRIFDRFYRGTNTGQARASGSGLGLAIVRSIVEMHGGTLDVASVVDEGTVFRITLPRWAGEADGDRPATVEPARGEVAPAPAGQLEGS